MVGAEVDMYTSVKNRIFSLDMRRAGMVIGIGKVCAVHQRPCVVVPAYHPTVDVLDHDVVWWLTKFFCKIVTASVALFHIFTFSHAEINAGLKSHANRCENECPNRLQWLIVLTGNNYNSLTGNKNYTKRVLRALNFAVLKTNEK